MLNIGDKVLFNSTGNSVPNYYSDYDGIPERMIIHGRSVQRDPEDGGIVEHLYEGYIIVSFIDDMNNKTQLGFREQSLIKVERDDFYETY